MSFDNHRNFAYSTVLTAPDPADSGTSLTVESGHGARFPAAPFNATVWPIGEQPIVDNAEIVRVTAVAGDVFTIVRAQEGSSARSILADDQIAATITAKTLTDVETKVLGALWKTRNLVLENGPAATSEVRTAADEITIEDVVVSTLNVTASITTSGPNGLDTGSEAPSTWYAVWLIYNPATQQVAALLSTSFTSPVMPSGYTKRRRVGAVRNNSASNFWHLRQVGDLVRYLEHAQTDQGVMNAVTGSTMFQSQSAATTVPPTSRELWAMVLLLPQQSPPVGFYTRPTGHPTTVGQRVLDSNIPYRLGVEVWIYTDASQSFDWREDVSTGANSVYLIARGYRDPVL